MHTRHAAIVAHTAQATHLSLFPALLPPQAGQVQLHRLLLLALRRRKGAGCGSEARPSEAFVKYLCMSGSNVARLAVPVTPPSPLLPHPRKQPTDLLLLMLLLLHLLRCLRVPRLLLLLRAVRGCQHPLPLSLRLLVRLHLMEWPVVRERGREGGWGEFAPQSVLGAAGGGAPCCTFILPPSACLPALCRGKGSG